MAQNIKILGLKQRPLNTAEETSEVIKTIHIAGWIAISCTQVLIFNVIYCNLLLLQHPIMALGSNFTLQ